MAGWRADQSTPGSASTPTFSPHYRPVAHQPPYRSGLDVLMSAASEVTAASSSSRGSRGRPERYLEHVPEMHTPGSSHPTSSATYSRRESSTSTRSKGVDSEFTEYTSSTCKDEVYSTRLIPDPRSLLPLMLTCKHLYKALHFESNPKLYHWMYMNTFDSEALTRRWKEYQNGGPNHEYAAVPLTRSPDRQSNGYHVQVKREPGLEDDEQRPATSGPRSCTHGVRENGTKCKCREGVHLLSDPVLLANEYKERFETFKRCREISARDSLKALMKTQEDKEQWTADVWVIWWMYMENGQSTLRDVQPALQIAQDQNFMFVPQRRSQKLSRARISGQIQRGRHDLLPRIHARGRPSTRLSHGLGGRRDPVHHRQQTRDRYRDGRDEGTDRYQGLHHAALCLCFSQGESRDGARNQVDEWQNADAILS